VHRAFRAVILLAVSSFAFIGAAQTSFTENPQITVSVYDDAEVSPDIVIRAEERAARIFLRSGFDITWINCMVLGRQSGAACNEFEGASHLVLHITCHEASSTSDAAFGVAFLGPGGTGRYGDVFWKKVQQVHEKSKLEIATVLGSVMAHEMGHLLLGSNAHAIGGIMRARWESGELRQIGRGTLLFLPEQEKRMRLRIFEARTLVRMSRERPGY
jgi:hypothetical protein